jgi:hypothetical protein
MVLKFKFMKILLLMFILFFSSLGCSQKLDMSSGNEEKDLASIDIGSEEDNDYEGDPLLAEFMELLDDEDDDEAIFFLEKHAKDFTKLYRDIDGDGQGFIHYAAAKGSLEVIKKFIELAKNKENLKKVVNLSSSQDGVQPIHLAAFRGDVEVLKFFIDNGADPNAKDSDANTVLHYAARRLTNVPAAKYLLEEASANIEKTIDEEDGSTLLHCAVDSNNASMVKYLLDYCYSNGKLDFISKKDNENLTAEDLANNLEMVNVVLVYSSFKKRTGKI